MDDLVERLETQADWCSDGSGPFYLFREAAAEITHLRSALAESHAREATVRAALVDIVDFEIPDFTYARSVAQAAIATPSPKAEALLRIVEAARRWAETRRSHSYTSIEMFNANSNLANAVDAYEAAYGEP